LRNNKWKRGATIGDDQTASTLASGVATEVRMSDPSLEAEVAAAKAYEALFVPALFGQWASRVVDAANLLAGQSVLDVACGTGVLAREALLRTGPTGYVAGLDPSNGMLAVARELRNGSLEPLLLDVQVSEGYPLWALLPPGRQRSPKVKVFLEFLTERLGLAPWRAIGRPKPLDRG